MSRRDLPVPAVAAAVLTAGVGLFQVALAAGAPWGRAAWGGGHPGTLPVGYRAASGVAACVWAAVAAGLVSPRLGAVGRRRLATGLVVVATASVVANAASRSPLERSVWTPFGLVLLACAWLLRRALRPARPDAALSSPGPASPAR